MGLQKVELDLWWVEFGLFFVEQTRTVQTDPAGSCLDSTGHPGRSKPVRFVPTDFLAGDKSTDEDGVLEWYSRLDILEKDKSKLHGEEGKEMGSIHGGLRLVMDDRGSHESRGKFGTKFGSRLIACSRFVAQTNVELSLCA
ncbi:hypothetical protein CRG98_017260 [Punica granatum]|uniref:Uncharacterized protein n=1 Tax=Punica granatum TaxID=22663 RepID=A0A2I0K1A4_PUNGR|nr:hypothetical protein CRG98_017260 [Punica granatum]